MLEKTQCPGCGRHCDLSDPHCERGKAYLRTGILPQREICERPHGDPAEPNTNEKVAARLRDICHRMRGKQEGKAGQKRILTILNESESLTQKELTDRVGVQPGSVSEILSKLENAGLITRAQNADDRRTTDIRLTEAGAQLARDALEKRHSHHEEMFSCLTAEEKDTLLSLLDKILSDWESRDPGRPGGHGGPHHGEHGHGGPGHGGPHHGEHGHGGPGHGGPDHGEHGHEGPGHGGPDHREHGHGGPGREESDRGEGPKAPEAEGRPEPFRGEEEGE